jgi:hypothetical protein
MRNETTDWRNFNSIGAGTVPWRPVQMRPLLRTNNGSAPILFGYSGGKLVSVPVGAIYSMTDGSLISNNTLTSPASALAACKNTYNGIGPMPVLFPATGSGGCTASVKLSTKTSSYMDFVTGNCIPCNLGTPTVATGQFTVDATTTTLTNAWIQYYASSAVYVRRIRYTPYAPTSVAQALITPNTWSTIGTAQFMNVSTCVATPSPSAAVADPASTPATDPTLPPAPAASSTAPGLISTVAAPVVDRTAYGGPLPGRSGAPVDAGSLTPQAAFYASASQCHYIEDAFEDDFNYGTFNISRWIPQGSVNVPSHWPASTTGKYNTSAYLPSTTPNAIGTLYGLQPWGGYQDHCPSAGAVGAANPSTCTYIDPNAMQINVDLEPVPAIETAVGIAGYQTSADVTNKVYETGAKATIAQQRCYDPVTGVNNPSCCVKQTVVVTKSPLVTTSVSVCSSWSGAHLSSQGCVQYGILETEAAFQMPPTGGALAFFGTYILGSFNPDGTAMTDTALTATTPDDEWNEIDQAFSNTTGVPTFGTALFISSQPYNLSTSTKNVGFGATQPSGLFSDHTPTSGVAGGCSTAKQCTTDNPASCPAYPMDSPTAVATAISAGMPKTVAGGSGCPAYPIGYLNDYHNYKLVWTPTWIAWLVDNIILRNESNDARGFTKSDGDLNTPGYVPWRPVTMRPLLRTNIGSAPYIVGTCAAGSACAGKVTAVPAGIIQTLAGVFIANNTLKAPSASVTACASAADACTATVNMTANAISKAAATEDALNTTAAMADYINGNCNPCNLVDTAPVITGKDIQLTGAYLVYLPVSTMMIRRVKYQPYSPEAVAYNMANAVSWKAGISAVPEAASLPVNYSDTTVPASPTPAPPPAAAGHDAFQVAGIANLAGISSASMTETAFATAFAKCLGLPAANVTCISVSAGPAYTPPAARHLLAAVASVDSADANFTIDLASAASETNMTSVLGKFTVADAKACFGTDLVDFSWTLPTVVSGTVSKATPPPPPKPTGTSFVGVATLELGGITVAQAIESDIVAGVAKCLAVPAVNVTIGSVTAIPKSTSGVDVNVSVVLPSAAAVVDLGGSLTKCNCPIDFPTLKCTTLTVTGSDVDPTSAPVAKPVATPAAPASTAPITYRVYSWLVMQNVTLLTFSGTDFEVALARALGKASIPDTAVTVITKDDIVARRHLMAATVQLNVSYGVDCTNATQVDAVTTGIASDLSATSLVTNGYPAGVTALTIGTATSVDLTVSPPPPPSNTPPPTAFPPPPGSNGGNGGSGSATQIKLNENKQLTIATICIVALLFGLFIISAIVRLLSSAGDLRPGQARGELENALLEETPAGFGARYGKRRILVGSSFLRGHQV